MKEIQKMHSAKNGWIKILMGPSESVPREFSNEWSCQYVSTISNFLGNFCVPPLVTDVTISPYKELNQISIKCICSLFAVLNFLSQVVWTQPTLLSRLCFNIHIALQNLYMVNRFSALLVEGVEWSWRILLILSVPASQWGRSVSRSSRGLQKHRQFKIYCFKCHNSGLKLGYQ
jgi:hypothetical protein